MLVFELSLPVWSYLFSAWTSKKNILFGPWPETCEWSQCRWGRHLLRWLKIVWRTIYL